MKSSVLTPSEITDNGRRLGQGPTSTLHHNLNQRRGTSIIESIVADALRPTELQIYRPKGRSLTISATDIPDWSEQIDEYEMWSGYLAHGQFPRVGLTIHLEKNTLDMREEAVQEVFESHILQPLVYSPTISESDSIQNSVTTTGSIRHPLVAWALASLRIMWSCVRHPNKPIWIDYRTGEVWLKSD